MRRSHHGLKLKSHSLCPNCNEPKHPHSVCEACGHYRGKQVIEPTQAAADFDTSFDTEA